MLSHFLRTVNGGVVDPYFNQVSLLLHGDGTNGAQNNTFLDSSTNNFTITRTGNVAQGTFSPFSLAEGQWSNYFDGSGDYLTAPNNTSLDMGSSSFTVEGWFYVETVTGTYLPIVTRFNGGAISSSDLQYFVYQSGSSLIMKAYSSTVVTITFSSAVTVGNWYHFALVRDGNTISGYLNGVKNATTGTITGSLYTGAWLTYIGGYREGSTWYYANGYISNVRIVKGTAVYTSNFTPPTTPLTAISGTSLLTCQSNRFKDNSSNNFTITPTGDTKVTAFSPFAPSAAYSPSVNGGSGYFDGAGDYLTTANSTNLNLSGSTFTIEAWVCPTAYAASPYAGNIFSKFSLGNGYYFFLFGTASAYNSIYFQGFSSNTVVTNLSCNYTFSLNQWYHIALVVNGSTPSIYINGVSQTLATSTFATWTDTASATGIGALNNVGSGLSYYYTGYITDLRIVKGTAVYTANFTPPTAPLTAVTNTQLLLNCTNAGIIDNAGKNDIETVGNAQISTSVKKYGTGSMYFDGGTTYLNLADRPELQLGSGDFTVEGWIYPATGIGRGIVCKGSGTTGWTLIFRNTSVLVFSDGATNTTSVATVTGNTWQHVAVVRSGTAIGNIKIYLNGVNVATSSYASTTNFNQTNALIVGADRGAASPYAGYIDDLRITKGQALYTSNFIPPTQAFPNV